MKRTRHGMALAVRVSLSAAVAYGGLSLTGAALAGTGPSFSLSPASGMPGESVKASGSGHDRCSGQPIGVVEFLWAGQQVAGQAAVPPDGSFSGSVMVPADAKPGSYLVQSRCLGGPSVSGAKFEVLGPAVATSVPGGGAPPTVTTPPAPRRVQGPSSVAPSAPAPTLPPDVAPARSAPAASPQPDDGGAPVPDPDAAVSIARAAPAAASAPGEHAAQPRRSSFAAATPDVSELTHSLGSIFASLVVAGLLILLVGFPAELFNKTLEENYDEVRGWFPWTRRSPSAPSTGHTVSNFAAFALVAALVYSFLDPELALDAGGLALALGLLVGIVVTTLAFELPIRAYLRRATGEVLFLRTFPGALLVAAALLAMSRLADFRPGYVYGVFAGYAVLGASRASRASDGRSVALAALSLAVVSLAAWLAWTPINAHVEQDPSVGLLVLDSVLVAIFVAGLETLAIGLLPIRFLDGHKLASWSRPLWLVFQGLAMFGFVYVLLRPETGPLDASGDASVVGMLALFAAFGVASVLFWAYFRFRPHRDGGAGPPVVEGVPSRPWYSPQGVPASTSRRSS